MRTAVTVVVLLVGACGNSSSDPPGDASADGGGDDGSAGSGGAACAELAQKFQSTLAQAKKCTPNLPAPTCDHPVDQTIDGCGFYTFGDASNTVALQKLGEISAQWDALDCQESSCALGGSGPRPSACVGAGGDAPGTCTSL